METIHEHAQPCQSARFPRAEALLQILELAALLRRVAARLDYVVEDDEHDHASARSAAIGIARAAVDELARPVAL